MDLRKAIDTAPDTVKSFIQYRSYSKGSHILHPDEHNELLFLVLSGDAEVYQYTLNGMFISLYHYTENTCFGEVEIYCPNRMTLGVMAYKACEIATITKEGLTAWISADKEFSDFILKQMAYKIADNSDAYLRSSSLTLKERVLDCIYRYNQMGTLKDLTKERLMNEVCVPLRSLNRVLAECSTEGILSYKKHQFYILDEEKLVH